MCSMKFLVLLLGLWLIHGSQESPLQCDDGATSAFPFPIGPDLLVTLNHSTLNEGARKVVQVTKSCKHKFVAGETAELRCASMYSRHVGVQWHEAGYGRVGAWSDRAVSVRLQLDGGIAGDAGLQLTCLAHYNTRTTNITLTFLPHHPTTTRATNYPYDVSTISDPVPANITACSPSPCGPHSVCAEVSGFPVCSCKKNFVGAPPSCRAKCRFNRDCSADQACHGETCEDPCVGVCGIHAECRVVNHVPVCVCNIGYAGNPYINCYLLPKRKINVCEPSPCGAHTTCKQSEEAASCSCLPNYRGDPYVGCRAKCSVNADCLSTEACVGARCLSPCGVDTCGANALCDVVDHKPVCICPLGYTGNPFKQCYIIFNETQNTHSLCQTEPCRVMYNCTLWKYQRICPHTESAPEPPGREVQCSHSSECAEDKTCTERECVDPCADHCGRNATCRVHLHVPICTCRAGFVGDAAGIGCVALSSTYTSQEVIYLKQGAQWKSNETCLGTLHYPSTNQVVVIPRGGPSVVIFASFDTSFNGTEYGCISYTMTSRAHTYDDDVYPSPTTIYHRVKRKLTFYLDPHKDGIELVRGGSKESVWVIVSAGVLALVLIVCLATCIVCRCRRRQASRPQAARAGRQPSSPAPAEWPHYANITAGAGAATIGQPAPAPAAAAALYDEPYVLRADKDCVSDLKIYSVVYETRILRHGTDVIPNRYPQACNPGNREPSPAPPVH